MSFGKNDSEAAQGGKFNQQVWETQSPYLNSLYHQAGELFRHGENIRNDMMGGVAGHMNLNANQMLAPWQRQLRGGAYQNLDANQVVNSINNSINSPSQTGRLYGDIMAGTGNAYLGGMTNMLRQNATDARNDGLAALDARAAASQMSGGARHGNAQGKLLTENDRNLQNQMTGLGYSTFDADLQNKLDIAAMADNNTLQRQQMLTGMLDKKQNAMTGGLGFGDDMNAMQMQRYAPTMVPWQAFGQYANVIGRPTVLNSGNFSGSSAARGFGLGI